jgi:hypothetical protein
MKMKLNKKWKIQIQVDNDIKYTIENVLIKKNEVLYEILLSRKLKDREI